MKKVITIFNTLLIILFFTACGNNAVETNEKSFNKKVKELESKQVDIQELTEFEWDSLYIFSPYTSKKEIEEVIGFESENIVDNMADESTTYLLFVKDNMVVANVYGSTNSLGYTFDFGEYEKYLCIDASKETTFGVIEQSGIKLLEYEQKK
ncbi:MAG: hypothetical protein IJF03_07350 [Lachnospiraceae bacterium]|nr:hypothetical protein [Lachnospiraceae bacterium]